MDAATYAIQAAVRRTAVDAFNIGLFVSKPCCDNSVFSFQSAVPTKFALLNAALLSFAGNVMNKSVKRQLIDSW